MMGWCASRDASFTLVNAGVSRIRTRIISPTMTSSALRRKGTRQPQDRNCSSGRRENTANTAVEITRPAGTPICGQLP